MNITHVLKWFRPFKHTLYTATEAKRRRDAIALAREILQKKHQATRGIYELQHNRLCGDVGRPPLYSSQGCGTTSAARIEARS